MADKLPINLGDLLRQRTVEGERIEYKAGWNPDAVIRTLCAFANDFENLGGGYVVIGQDCDAGGQPAFPPVGLVDSQLDKIQRELQAGRAVSRRYRNRRIGEFPKELDLTEGRATGIPKILRAMGANGSPSPVFETDEERTSFVVRLPRHPLAQAPEEVAGEVTGEVGRLLRVLVSDMSRQQIQAALGLKGEEHFRKAYLTPALATGMVEMTRPDKPRSSRQRYRLTAKGRQWLRASQ